MMKHTVCIPVNWDTSLAPMVYANPTLPLLIRMQARPERKWEDPTIRHTQTEMGVVWPMETQSLSHR